MRARICDEERVQTWHALLEDVLARGYLCGCNFWGDELLKPSPAGAEPDEAFRDGCG